MLAEMRTSPLYRHGFFLAGFCILMVCVWMTPVVLAGFPYQMTYLVQVAHEFTATGIMTDVIHPLFVLLLSALLPVIEWRNSMGWALVSSITMALSIIPLWWTIARLTNVRYAWATVLLFCLLPMHWVEAVGTAYYPLAFLCLFTGFTLFLLTVSYSRWMAVVLLGICFGGVLATTHSFFPLLPWFVLVYAWERRTHPRSMVLELVLCGVATYLMFVLPLLPNALRPRLTPIERVAVLLPVEENLMPPEELYGDEYAYIFLKEEFDQQMLEQAKDDSFFVRRRGEHFRINYSVGEFGIFHVLLNNTWLLINNLAALFMLETVGGVFIWLFLLPGCVALFREHRKFFLQLIGLYISMEIILRFGFHYGRIHLMDVGWIFAFICGAGVIFLADTLEGVFSGLRSRHIATILLCIGAFQLIQANRIHFAREYSRSSIPRAYAVATALQALPENAVIARPWNDHLMVFSERESIALQNRTIDILREKQRLAEPFLYYGITHIIGYDAERTAEILEASPSVQAVYIPPASPIVLTPFKRYLLNLIR